MKSCAFCPGEDLKMSGEHLWSEWIGKSFGPKKYQFWRIDHDKNARRDWTGSKINMTAKVVCEECNGGWMSDLENEASSVMRPMILDGTELSLLPLGIAAISTFAFEKAVIADHMHPTRLPFFSYLDRYAFRQTLAIPEGVHIWIGEFIGTYERSGFIQTNYTKLNRGRIRGFELYVCTYIAGRLAIQVLATRWYKKYSRRREPFPLFQQPREFRDCTNLLWPNRGEPVLWPLTYHLDDDVIEQFCHRFARILVPTRV